MSEPLDLGEAADYILGQRSELSEDDVWAVLNELRDPPTPGQDGLALELIAASRPELDTRTARTILREWRAYSELAVEPDWEDED